jgi:hypothetical protein
MAARREKRDRCFVLSIEERTAQPNITHEASDRLYQLN